MQIFCLYTDSQDRIIKV